MKPEYSNYLLTRQASLGLDLIRTLASQAVVLGHAMSFFGVFTFLQVGVPRMQEVAVVIFFVLSGFLICMTSMRKKGSLNYSFKGYFFDRFARIYSGYIPALFFVLALDTLSIYLHGDAYPYGEKGYTFWNFVANLFMLQDHPSIKVFTSFGSARPFWTIAVEWWMYMWFGWLIFRPKNLNIVLFLIVLVIFSSEVVHHFIKGRGTGLAFYWVMGVAIYFISANKALSFMSRSSCFFMALFFGVLSYLGWMEHKIAYHPVPSGLFAIALCFLIETLNRLPVHQNENCKTEQKSKTPTWENLLRFTADYSFMLYLIHYSILDFIRHFEGWEQGQKAFWFAVVLSNLVSALFAVPTEMQYRKLANWMKNRWGI